MNLKLCSLILVYAAATQSHAETAVAAPANKAQAFRAVKRADPQEDTSLVEGVTFGSGPAQTEPVQQQPAPPSVVNKPIVVTPAPPPVTATPAPPPATIAPPVPKADPAPVTTTTTTPAPPAPAAPPKPDLPPMPACSQKNPQYTVDWRVIDKTLTDVVGYKHAFNRRFDLVETRMNEKRDPCHTTLSFDSRGTPRIEVTGCDYKVAPKPVKACLAGEKVRFVEDLSGAIFQFNPDIVEIEKGNDDSHWRVWTQRTVLGITGTASATLREGLVSQVGR